MEVAYRAACVGFKSLIISLEMVDLQVGQRYLSKLTGISVSRFRKYDFGVEELNGHAADVQEHKALENISFVLSSRTTIDDISSIAYSFSAKNKIDLLIVDYIGRVAKHDRRMDRTEHITEVVGELKNLAIDLHLPVLGLAQLNRVGQKTVELENLADSAAIERDSDAVWLLSEVDKGKVHLEFAKNRQGPKGFIELGFESSRMNWSEE